jgi:hypothetical protein
MDYSFSSVRASKGRLIVARQFIAGKMAKREFLLSPIGTTEPMPVGAGLKPAFGSDFSERAGLKPAPTFVPNGTLRFIVVIGTGDESPAYYRSVHPGREKLRD